MKPTQVLNADLVHNAEFWFDDGNIVIIARNEAFRVHKSILCRQSPVLGDALAACQLPGDTQCEGCPLVILPHSPEVFVHFLRVLYDGRNYFRKDKNAQLNVIVALAALGHKYGIHDVREDAVRRLKTVYTTYFAEWKSFLAKAHPGLSTCSPPSLFAVVNLAHDLREVSILPTALYLCCQLDSATLLGSRKGEKDAPQLRMADKIRCINGKVALAEARLAFLHYIWDAKPSPKCQHHADSQCSKAIEKQRRVLGLDAPGATEPCFALFLPCAQDIREAQLCANCTNYLLEKHGKARHSHWVNLPRYMGVEVPGWTSADPSVGR